VRIPWRFTFRCSGAALSRAQAKECCVPAAQTHQLFCYFRSISLFIECQCSFFERTKRPKISQNAVTVWNPDPEIFLNIIKEEHSISSSSHGKRLFDTAIFTPETRLLKNGYRVHFEYPYRFWSECRDFFVKDGLKPLSADRLPFHEKLPFRRIYYCFGAVGVGGARRSASEITAMDRAPFFPTDRTAK
jgi:hypothetical protein